MYGKMEIILFTLVGLSIQSQSFAYVPMTTKEHYISDVFLRDLVDGMGKDLLDTSDDLYYDPLMNQMPPASHLSLMSRASSNKDLETEQMDYDALLDSAAAANNPNPSIRDQEYMQHSSLWGHQYVSGGAGEIGLHRIKPQIKTDATLPAYCNPPNPCPYGYTEEQGCIMDFENTAAFSREYQASQECMCDSEHMFDCPGSEQSDDNRQMASDLESFLARQFHTGEHKNLVAKKFHPSIINNDAHQENIENSEIGEDKKENPFLQGEKLPVAAKKGFNAV